MKRLLVSVLAASAMASCYGYTHQIKNACPFPIRVKVDVVGPDYNIELRPGEVQNVDVLAWCTNGFEARYIGPDPKYSGFIATAPVPGITCRGYNVVVQYDPPVYSDPFNPLPIASSNLTRGVFRIIVN